MKPFVISKMTGTSASSIPRASSNIDATKILTEKWRLTKRDNRNRVRKIAFDDSVRKVYVKTVQPVVLREIRNKTVRHVVQPIIHELDEESEQVETFVRPISYRETHEDIPENLHDKISRNQHLIAQMAGHEVDDDDITAEEHFENEHVQVVEHEEVANEIQPIVKRKINRKILINETQPIHETVHRVVGVDDVKVSDELNANEWQRRKSDHQYTE